jgi:hypothetical protein
MCYRRRVSTSQLAAGCDAAASIPSGVQPDWEAMLRWGAVQVENSVDPALESAWFQTLILSSDTLVSKFLLSNTTCTATLRARPDDFCEFMRGWMFPGGQGLITSAATGHSGWISLVGAAADVAALPDVAATLRTYQDMVHSLNHLVAEVGRCRLNQVDPYPIAYNLSNP